MPHHERRICAHRRSTRGHVLERLDLGPRFPTRLRFLSPPTAAWSRFKAQRELRAAAYHVPGCQQVPGVLTSTTSSRSPPRSDRREDDEIRGAALQALILDVEVPSDSVDVKVDDGWVTPKGNVSYQFESDAAYDDVASLYGVYRITNEIKVTNP